MAKEISLEEKIKTNTWDHIKDVLPVIEDMRRKKWSWAMNSRCKYIELRIDTRDGGCIIMDRDGERISLDQLKRQ